MRLLWLWWSLSYYNPAPDTPKDSTVSSLKRSTLKLKDEISNRGDDAVVDTGGDAEIGVAVDFLSKNLDEDDLENPDPVVAPPEDALLPKPPRRFLPKFLIFLDSVVEGIGKIGSCDSCCCQDDEEF